MEQLVVEDRRRVDSNLLHSKLEQLSLDHRYVGPEKLKTRFVEGL